MKNVRVVLGVSALLAVVGCATAKTWSATGGSRSDGVVRLSYEYGMFERPQTNEVEALALAKKRCAVWGYTDAEAFGGQTQVCNSMSTSGCARYLVTKEYQCTGANTPS